MAEIEDRTGGEQDPIKVIVDSGGRLAAQGRNLAEALRRLDSSLPDIRSMCGNDDAGRDLAAKLGPAAENLHSFVDSMSKGLDSVGKAVAAMGPALAATDRASTVKPK